MATARPERLLPLFLVTGASGVGKTTLIPELRRLLPDFDVFDLDLMRGPDWNQIKCNWLRIALAIAGSGRGTVICGTFVPENLTGCDCVDGFSRIHYLNLHCAPDEQAARLRARGWSEEAVTQHQQFAQWLLDHAESHFDPPLVTVENTRAAVAETAAHVRDWVLARWPG